MTGGEKRSFDQMEEGSSVDVDDAYVLSSEECRTLEKCAFERPKFIRYREHNYYLDTDTKMAAIKADQSIVSLVSFSGEVMITQSCGTIIERVDNVNTVLTSLSLVRQHTEARVMMNSLAKNLKVIVHSADETSYLGEIEASDFHYNILLIKFKSITSFPIAKLNLLTLNVDQVQLRPHSIKRSFELRPHSIKKINTDDSVIVVGRYFREPFELMAAPGEFSTDRSMLLRYDCNELLTSSCRITRCGDGSPVIDLAGEVIGIAYYMLGAFSPILPIDVAHKWWSHYKKFKESRHPSYGFIAFNMHSAFLSTFARVLKKFPSISNGLLVDKVMSGSNAEAAGLRKDDIIIKCDGKSIKSFVEVWSMMLDKVGDAVELEVVRVDLPSTLSISVVVGEATPNELNKWPRFDC